MKYKFSLTIECDDLSSKIGSKQAENLLTTISLIFGVDRRNIYDVALHHITGIDNLDNIEIPWYLKKSGRNLFDISKFEPSMNVIFDIPKLEPSMSVKMLDFYINNRLVGYYYPIPDEYRRRVTHFKMSYDQSYVVYYDKEYNYLCTVNRRGDIEHGKHD